MAPNDSTKAPDPFHDPEYWRARNARFATYIREWLASDKATRADLRDIADELEEQRSKESQ